MRLVKARVQGYRSVLDSGWLDVENGKTILVGQNEAGKTAILQALQKLNPPKDVELFNPLRDYPHAKYDEDIEKGGIDPSSFTVLEGHFYLEDSDAEELPEAYRNITYVYGRHLDNSAWHRLDNALECLTFSAIEKMLLKLVNHFQETAKAEEVPDAVIDAIQTEFDTIVNGLDKSSVITTEKAMQVKVWLKKYLKYLDEDNVKENERYDRVDAQLDQPTERASVWALCEKMMPKFILLSNYFRIKPVLHLRKFANRIVNNSLDDSQY